MYKRINGIDKATGLQVTVDLITLPEIRVEVEKINNKKFSAVLNDTVRIAEFQSVDQAESNCAKLQAKLEEMHKENIYGCGKDLVTIIRNILKVSPNSLVDTGIEILTSISDEDLEALVTFGKEAAKALKPLDQEKELIAKVDHIGDKIAELKGEFDFRIIPPKEEEEEDFREVVPEEESFKEIETGSPVEEQQVVHEYQQVRLSLDDPDLIKKLGLGID